MSDSVVGATTRSVPLVIGNEMERWVRELVVNKQDVVWPVVRFCVDLHASMHDQWSRSSTVVASLTLFQ